MLIILCWKTLNLKMQSLDLFSWFQQQDRWMRNKELQPYYTCTTNSNKYMCNVPDLSYSTLYVLYCRLVHIPQTLKIHCFYSRIKLIIIRHRAHTVHTVLSVCTVVQEFVQIIVQHISGNRTLGGAVHGIWACDSVRLLFSVPSHYRHNNKPQRQIHSVQ